MNSISNNLLLITLKLTIEMCVNFQQTILQLNLDINTRYSKTLIKLIHKKYLCKMGNCT